MTKLNETSRTDFSTSYAKDIKAAIAKLKALSSSLKGASESVFEKLEAVSGQGPLAQYDEFVIDRLMALAMGPAASITEDKILDIAFRNYEKTGTEPQFTVFAIDDLVPYVAKKAGIVTFAESSLGTAKARVREGIISSKDGDKTFDQLYGANGVQPDDVDEEWAQAFSHCFESANGTTGKRLREGQNVSTVSSYDTLSTDKGDLFDEEHEDEGSYFDFIQDMFGDGDPNSVATFFEILGRSFRNAGTMEEAYSDAVEALRAEAREILSGMFSKSDDVIIQTLPATKIGEYIVKMLNMVGKNTAYAGLSNAVKIPSNQRATIEESAKRAKGRVRESELSENELSENELPEHMVKDYMARADAERHGGGKIEISSNPVYVAITMSDGSEYFFEDHEADELLSEVPININQEDFILAIAQGW